MTHSPLAAVLGRLPSGIFILSARTSAHGQSLETGMLASWVMQAGFEPPMVTVAVGSKRYLAEWLAHGEPFALSLVGHEQASFLKHFGKGFEPGEPAFAGLELTRSPAGLPVLRASLGYLECRVRSHVDSEDHRIFLAEVLAGELFDADTRPMVHVRKNGLHY
ncbi:MAG: flavin reductase [Planctomycetaceae bacterium]|nr:flavin reductase [Planctomycetaceae bacterium]